MAGSTTDWKRKIFVKRLGCDFWNFLTDLLSEIVTSLARWWNLGARFRRHRQGRGASLAEFPKLRRTSDSLFNVVHLRSWLCNIAVLCWPLFSDFSAKNSRCRTIPGLSRCLLSADGIVQATTSFVVSVA